MNYPIPVTAQDLIALRQEPITEELVATAIVGVIHQARAKNQTLEELVAEVLADDTLMNHKQRLWLSELVVHVWTTMP
jgi:hypothetical protein